MLAGVHIPDIPSEEIDGRIYVPSFSHKVLGTENVGTRGTCIANTWEIVSAQLSEFGVNVAVIVVPPAPDGLMDAGLHMPDIPSSDMLGRISSSLDSHKVSGRLNPGVWGFSMEMSTDVVWAQKLPSGVKVVVITVPPAPVGLMDAGFQEPVIPSMELVGSV